jgi:hypothetical protein
VVCVGQSVVQMLEQERTRKQYAAKFFISARAYRREHRLYNSSPLAHFMPHVHCQVPEGGLVDSSGDALPACIVMEKGEPLDAWLATPGKLDKIGCLQVSCTIFTRKRCPLFSCRFSGIAVQLFLLSNLLLSVLIKADPEPLLAAVLASMHPDTA